MNVPSSNVAWQMLTTKLRNQLAALRAERDRTSEKPPALPDAMANFAALEGLVFGARYYTAPDNWYWEIYLDGRYVGHIKHDDSAPTMLISLSRFLRENGF